MQATATTSSYRSSGVAVLGPSFPFLLLLRNRNDVTAFAQFSGSNTLALYLFHALSSSSNPIGLKDSAISFQHQRASCGSFGFSVQLRLQLSAFSISERLAAASASAFSFGFSYQLSASASALRQLRLQRSASASAISFQLQRAPCGSFGFSVQLRLQLSASAQRIRYFCVNFSSAACSFSDSVASARVVQQQQQLDGNVRSWSCAAVAPR